MVAIELEHDWGAYNPYTLEGNLIVDGVLASSHSDWLLDPLMDALGLTHWLPATYQVYPLMQLVQLKVLDQLPAPLGQLVLCVAWPHHMMWLSRSLPTAADAYLHQAVLGEWLQSICNWLLQHQWFMSLLICKMVAA